jgi:hypothetical protein
MQELISWDIYEVNTTESTIHGVMIRGRIRKFCLESGRNVLTENASDVEGVVRFAVPNGEEVASIEEYLHRVLPDAAVTLVKEGVQNPVLSKLKVNIEDRYTL